MTGEVVLDQVDGCVDQESTEDVEDPTKSCDCSCTNCNKYKSQDESDKNSDNESLALSFLGHLQLCKNDQKDEEVVDRQAFFGYEPSQILFAIL